MNKMLFGAILVLSFVSALHSAFMIEPAKTTQSFNTTIFINADGSIDPRDAPILSLDNVTYTMTENITFEPWIDGVVIMRDNIVFEGNGFTLQGYSRSLLESGIYLDGRRNVTVRNAQIGNFHHSIALNFSSDNSIIGNTLTDSDRGIEFYYSSNNSISGNTISNNIGGIWLGYSTYNDISGNAIDRSFDGVALDRSSSYNRIRGNNITNSGDYGIEIGIGSGYTNISGNNISGGGMGGIWLDGTLPLNITTYHNNFSDNNPQVFAQEDMGNIWDNGYPSGGNYWSDYVGADLCSGLNQNETGSDGIGDTPYVIDGSNWDRYPLIKPFAQVAGDINEDRIVDIFDCTMIAFAFNSKPGDPNWNPTADVNIDLLVDIFDLVVVALHFGETS